MIYASNLHFATGDIDVPVAEGYTHNLGPVQAMLDNMENHSVIFEALIGNDFMELHAERNPEVFSEAQIEAIHEASTNGFIQKVVEFARRCWEKIKGFFKSFWDTIRATLTRDNKELVNKFKGEVVKKDLSKMKYKFAQPTEKSVSMPSAETLKASAWDSLVVPSLKMTGGSIDAIHAQRDKVNSTEYKEKMLGASIGKSTVATSEYAKEADAFMFEEVKDYEGLSTSALSDIMSYLSESGKLLKDMKKNEQEVDKVFKKILGDLDKARTVINKNIPDGKSTEKYTSVTSDDKSHDVKTGDKDSRTKASLAISLAYDIVNVAQYVTNKSMGAAFAGVKKCIKQSRAVFMAAVRFNPKAVKESNVMFEHYTDESNYEFDMLVEGAGF